jgi:glycosyltransferase involved in cell wall biosynthesis
VHSHTRRADLVAGYAALSSGAKSAVTHHGQINLDGKTFQFKNGLNEKIYNFILRNYYAVNVAVSYKIAEELNEMCGVEKGRVRVIPNGINPAPFEVSPEKREAARAKYGLAPDDVAVVTVASLGRKGHNDLVEAAALLAADCPQAMYLFAGTGFGREAIEVQIADAGLTDTVRLLGFIEDIPELLAAADIFCLPTYSEGLSIAIMEAMAAGLPFTASEVGGNLELIEDGTNGFVFPARDPAALAEALRPLLDDHELRTSIGERNRVRVGKLFTADRMAENYAQLYRDLMS